MDHMMAAVGERSHQTLKAPSHRDIPTVDPDVVDGPGFAHGLEAASCIGYERIAYSEGMEPNFIVIGAMKSGTTSLHAYLRDHPQVFMPEKKELHFFVEEWNWKRGWEWYRSLFAAAGPQALAVGEASPTYTKYPDFPGVPEKIVRLLPDVRLIYIIRQPIDRMCSHFLHLSGGGAERLPIDRALLENPLYLNVSRYAMQLGRYLEHFPFEQILVVKTEELKSNRQAAMERIFGFLGVDSAWSSPVLRKELNTSAFAWAQRVPGYRTISRVTPEPAKMFVRRTRLATQRLDPKSGSPSSEVRARLEDLLREDMQRLRTLLGPGFDGWGLA
jgi:Sulfotransferase family